MSAPTLQVVCRALLHLDAGVEQEIARHADRLLLAQTGAADRGRQPVPLPAHHPCSAVLLIAWVAAFAIIRGIRDIVLAFRVREVQHAAR